MDLSEFSKHLPTGSSAYAQVLAEIKEKPDLQVTKADDETDGTGSKHGHHNNHNHHHHHSDKDGKIVHGLHHCYKIEGGQCHAKYGCNHIHAPADASLSPSMGRRRSVSMLPGAAGFLSIPEDSSFRGRSSSDAANRRRLSIPAGHIHSPARSNSGHLDGTPEESPVPMPNRQRRGSNVVLHSDELHYVYDQLKGK
ncbi:hypothetical protein PoB_003155800 [Plakobranchus ocellatus]|uniref:C3H1-type domain-containing protein n=1 Tax=Plakobranchus ocellatus TaxID=259542 RepID=A0AAV4AES0_9GAST|nr:hypothetical protein PoB_003155800 [Plakobranchus ocellatus]